MVIKKQTRHKKTGFRPWRLPMKSERLTLVIQICHNHAIQSDTPEKINIAGFFINTHFFQNRWRLTG
jgi:hypothetical protein